MNIILLINMLNQTTTMKHLIKQLMDVLLLSLSTNVTFPLFIIFKIYVSSDIIKYGETAIMFNITLAENYIRFFDEFTIFC